MTIPALMIIARNADAAGNIMISGCQFEAGASCMLTDGCAVKLLPRRLMRREGEAAFGFELGLATLQFFLRDQDIGRTLVEVDADPVASLEDRKAAIGGSFRTGVEDGGRA